MEGSDFMDGLEIDKTKLGEELAMQAANYAYAAEQHAKWERQYEIAKMQAKESEAAIYASVRRQLVSEGEKTTEKLVEMRVRQDAQFKKLQQRVIDARMIADRYKAKKEAWTQRHGMLTQLAINERTEKQSLFRDTIKE